MIIGKSVALPLQGQNNGDQPALRMAGNQEPTWEIARFFPSQGQWSEFDYLNLESLCGEKVRVELAHGRLEFLPMPTEDHQLIIMFFLNALFQFTKDHAPGTVVPPGIRVRIKNGADPKFREPDVAYMKKSNAHRRNKIFWEGADLVMEVVSSDPKDRDRDYVIKVQEYAEGGIAEYWIVDPTEQRIRIHVLIDDAYQFHGDFGAGTIAKSRLLPGFAVVVNEIMTAGQG